MASHVIRLFLLVAIMATAMVYGDSDEEETEFDIDVLYKPDVCKREAKAGDYITLTYVAFVIGDSGNDQFDSSDSLGPVHFKLHDPASTAMQGWHRGVEGMCINERRELIIPPGELTANHRLPNTKVPPEGRTMGYQVEVRNIQDEPPAGNLFRKMDYNANQEITKEEMKAYFSKHTPPGRKPSETLDQAVENIFINSDHDQSGTLSENELFGRNRDEL